MNTVALRTVSSLALLGAALAASAQTVVNGGFETGDFTGWTVTNAATSSALFIDTFYVHSGTYEAVFGAFASLPDTISQSISTIVGRSYTVSYYLINESTSTTAGAFSFVASFGGTSQTTTTTPSTTAYTLKTFTATATSASTRLSFAGYNNPSYTDLDDVSVVLNPVPEPSALAALGLGAVAVLRRRKRA